MDLFLLLFFFFPCFFFCPQRAEWPKLSLVGIPVWLPEVGASPCGRRLYKHPGRRGGDFRGDAAVSVGRGEERW